MNKEQRNMIPSCASSGSPGYERAESQGITEVEG